MCQLATVLKLTEIVYLILYIQVVIRAKIQTEKLSIVTPRNSEDELDAESY